MKAINKIFFLFTFLFGLQNGAAQSLLEELENEHTNDLEYTFATFKANRIGIGHSVETRKKGTLELVVGTRYWNIPSNSDNRKSFVVDRFSARFGLDYAISDRFTMGVGLSTFDAIGNVFGKYKLLRQVNKGKGSPIAITLFQGSSLLTRSYTNIVLPEKGADRFSYASQVIFARKFNRSFSLQLAPMYIRTNSLQANFDTNNHFVIGLGGRLRLGAHTTLTSEYYYVAGRDQGPQGYNPFSLGLNWEIGDVIFQFSLNNAKSFDETGTILYSPNNFNFNDGGLHVGVNFTYVIHTKNRKP